MHKHFLIGIVNGWLLAKGFDFRATSEDVIYNRPSRNRLEQGAPYYTVYARNDTSPIPMTFHIHNRPQDMSPEKIEIKKSRFEWYNIIDVSI